MTPSALRRLSAFVLLGATLAACGGDSSSPTAPTNSSTDTFSSTLDPGGIVTHPFTIAGPGSLSISVDTVSTTGLVFGLGLGDWNGTTSVCTLQLSSATAKQGDVFNATASQAGNYCVQVADIGNVQSSATYTLRVTHP